jgi:hypothetical protein
MNRRTSLALGAASVLPVIACVAMVGWMALLVSDRVPTDPAAVFVPFMGMTVITGLISLGLTAYFLWDAVTAPSLDAGQRAAWVVLLLFATIPALPAYWWFRFRPLHAARQRTTAMA